MKTYKCAFHSSNIIVNFCRNQQCLLPMCPTCIKIHTHEHAKQNTHGDYDNIYDVENEVSATMQQTIRKLIHNGRQLQDIYQLKIREKMSTIKKMEEMRVKIIEAMNKFIDGLEEQILGSVKEIEKNMEQDFKDIDTGIDEISREVEGEMEDLKGEKTMKTIIAYFSSNMPMYYVSRLSEIAQKISKVKSMNICPNKQFRVNQIHEVMKNVCECYHSVFSEILKSDKSEKSEELNRTMPTGKNII